MSRAVRLQCFPIYSIYSSTLETQGWERVCAPSLKHASVSWVAVAPFSEGERSGLVVFVLLR